MSLAWPGLRFHLQHRKAKQLYQRNCGSTPVIPAWERQKDHGFDAIFSYIRLCRKEKLPVILPPKFENTGLMNVSEP